VNVRCSSLADVHATGNGALALQIKGPQQQGASQLRLPILARRLTLLVHECCCLCAGHPIAGNIAEVHLKQGDVLIVEAGPEFLANFKNNRAFSLISEVPKSSPMKRSKMWIALVLTVAMVATQV
jgi:hypothetical protein